MKTVFSNSELAHEWAYQSQNNGRTTNHSFYFEGRTIYSYGGHFPIASFDPNNNNVVFFTTRSYSNTTAKHISLTLHAINHKTVIYCYNPKNAARGIHLENILQFEHSAKIISYDLAKSKKPEIYLSKINEQRRMLEAYANHFSLNLEDFSLFYVYIQSKEEGKEASEKEIKKLAELQAKQAKELRSKVKKEIKLFRDFKINNLQYRDGFDFLRYNPNKEAIETSQGVLIELPIAKKLYTQIIETIKTGNCTLCGENFMDRYEIKEISPKQIVIGCHTISNKEIMLMAKQMNWTI